VAHVARPEAQAFPHGLPLFAPDFNTEPHTCFSDTATADDSNPVTAERPTGSETIDSETATAARATGDSAPTETSGYSFFTETGSDTSETEETEETETTSETEETETTSETETTEATSETETTEATESESVEEAEEAEAKRVCFLQTVPSAHVMPHGWPMRSPERNKNVHGTLTPV
jgi:hypothetical protein